MNINPANHVFHALTGMFSVTVEDICSDMPLGKHVLHAVTYRYHIPPTTEIRKAIRWMDRLIKSQVSFRQAKSVWYDSGLLVSLVKDRDALEHALDRREMA